MNEQRKTGFLDRALRNLRGAWDKIARGQGDFSSANLSPELNDEDRARLIEQMVACLEGVGGEVSARGRAAALGHAYLALNEAGRKRFLTVLAEEFDVDHDLVKDAAERVQNVTADTLRRRAEQDLRAALVAPRVRLLTQFNGLPEGVKFLVDMRAELLAIKPLEGALKDLEQDLKGLMAAWFDIGFLELRQITWQAPAALLEKLAAYEAVHRIQGWEDLKHRLAPDRRCYAFFHPSMPEEPLIFVWVALVKGMSDNIQALLDEDGPNADPETADTAVFYSISNAQVGLRGINFGDFLIKRVVNSLSRELKNIKAFVTLSPIPGFVKWLETALEDGEPLLLTDEEAEELTEAFGKIEGEVEKDQNPLKAALDKPKWHRQKDLSEAMKAPLLRYCAHYLMHARRPEGTAMDPVAHFHLSNGASMGRLNWLADTSRNGLAQSAGIMINYLYELDEIEDNHEAYLGRGEIKASSATRGHLKT